MVYIPKVEVAPCQCGKVPKLKSKIFSNYCQLRCECGVAGAWIEYSTYDNIWNVAGRGWPFPLQRQRPPAPAPMRKVDTYV